MRLAWIVAASLIGSAAQAQTPPMVGGDRDAHGCIGSAGYTWCPREAQCARPWELAALRGFPNTPRAFRRWCFPARR